MTEPKFIAFSFSRYPGEQPVVGSDIIRVQFDETSYLDIRINSEGDGIILKKNTADGEDQIVVLSYATNSIEVK